MINETDATWGVFISYSRMDRNIVAPITDLMRITGAKVFRDEDSILPGKKWKIIITESLNSARTVVVFWCGHSAQSDAVKFEYKTAIELNKDVVPILLDETVLSDELREYQWIDFRSFTTLRENHCNVLSIGDAASAVGAGAVAGLSAGTAAGIGIAAGAAVVIAAAPVVLPIALIGGLVGAGIALLKKDSNKQAPLEPSITYPKLTKDEEDKIIAVLTKRILSFA
ncbi:toll/interleukin-1 receptor domain-containing protein [Methylomagnum ishizawai]|uniref:toll/interleukin-1 receptor domain-containing protein n=1 Tax=Methylomagnum ishizawai TaxID=1760988 RepID=UPI001C323B0E|nr:toll/interleukin-1 receptor domain-containing protein [Methylomagnum ishizawai]BBL77490.1 hypothetical protein MishRS11D_45880 [Methylomagnum ishizawai]